MYDFIDVKVSEDTILQPDVSIVCKHISKNYLDFPAALVVEILSPATAFKDRHVKFSLYEKMRMKYFLIVDSDKCLIEIFTLEDQQYKTATYNKAFQFLLENDCSIDVELNNIWE